MRYWTDVMPMRLSIACSLLVLAAAGPVRADTAAQLAEWFGVPSTAVREVAGFELPAGGDYTHVLVGRYEQSGLLLGGAAILRCDTKQCTGARISFHATDRVEVYGLIDLNGTPGPLPATPHAGHRGSYRKLDAGGLATRPAWPAIVLHAERAQQATGQTKSRTTVTGVERHGQIRIVSLLRADEPSPTVLTADVADLHPSGAGTTTTFRTQRGDAKDALDLIGREQRHLDRTSRCLRPDPVDVRYVLKGRRYERVDLPARSGC
jgi:hypothetical protein